MVPARVAAELKAGIMTENCGISGAG